MEVLEIDKFSFDKEVLLSDTLTLVYFYANWAGTCSMLEDSITTVYNQIGSLFKITKVDIDKNQELANALSVISIPTLFFYKDSQLIERFSGVQDYTLIKDKILLYA